MSHDTIPEAREAATEIHRDTFTSIFATPELWTKIINKWMIAHHQRRLAECGDIESIRNTLATCDDPLNKAIELLQLHTAKAVEEATEKLKEERNKAAMLERQKYLPQLATLQKQCEELRERVDWLTLQRQVECEQKENALKESEGLLKERDDLRTRAEKVEADVIRMLTLAKQMSGVIVEQTKK